MLQKNIAIPAAYLNPSAGVLPCSLTGLCDAPGARQLAVPRRSAVWPAGGWDSQGLVHGCAGPRLPLNPARHCNLALQVAYVNAPISTDWLSGELRTYYVYTQFAQSTSAEDMSCIPFRAANRGVVCVGFENDSEPGNPYQVAVM